MQAGSSAPKAGAEIQVVALADPERFRDSVLAARRLLNGRGTDGDRERLNLAPPVFGSSKEGGNAAEAVLGAASPGEPFMLGGKGDDNEVRQLLGQMNDRLGELVEIGRAKQ